MSGSDVDARPHAGRAVITSRTIVGPATVHLHHLAGRLQDPDREVPRGLAGGTPVAFRDGMRSRAAIGNHPIHPMLVPFPIGAFFLALIGDIAYSADAKTAFWYELSYVCIAVGISSALLAAVAGAIDYFSVKMSGKGFRLATWHALLNVLMLVLYTTSFFLRRHGAAASGSRWVVAAALGFLGFGLVAVTGWLGGSVAHEHRVGVIERLNIVKPAPHKNERAAS